MRVVVVSDIHANYHALRAVLAAVDEGGYDELWSLGDVVGYGPQPNRCCEVVAARASLCLAGNHDLAALGTIRAEAFNDDAAAAVRWTADELDAGSRAFLSGLEPAAAREGVELFHGSPVDPVWDYVLDASAAYRAFLATVAPLVLVGHTHLAVALGWHDGTLSRSPCGAGDELSLGRARMLLNPGSVGQPRGGDPRAAWLERELEDGAGWARFRRTPYEVEATQAELRAAGLPEALAARLASGL
jgi:diadenosine tetraphosphatase ApaH/serine/threonine PP2A family protein phosphatase